MDWADLSKRLSDYLKKYGYVALILGAGIFLMLLPGKDREAQTPQSTVAETQSAPSTQEALEESLSHIDGAGKVKVLLTLSEGESTIYQSDSSTAADTIKIETVIITDENKAQHGLVQQVNPPVYLGAVVVCQGADSAAVRLAVTEAVADATGLTTDKITVLKMK